MNLQEIFKLGMKRELNELIEPGLKQLNLGSGNSPSKNAVNIDYPEWDATKNPIPYDNESLDTVWAFHFFEHFDGETVIKILHECERVLKTGGTLNIVVPHRLGSMAYHDLDHKTFWSEDTMKILLSTPYYNKNREVPWKFEINMSLIIGIVERNLALIIQLIKI